MQLYAFDASQRLTSVRHAIKRKDYFCLECQQIVRVRGGVHRHKHYYHLAPNIACRLSGKGMAHLQIQEIIQRSLPKGESFLEYRFPAVNRIGDVVWPAQKLVFEIQCASISAEEIDRRNRDYLSQGFEVVWILHDNRYNKYRVSAAELYLQNHCFYFTNIDINGQGMIYDQFDIIYKGLRQQTLAPLRVDVSQPKKIDPNHSILPQHADRLKIQRTLYFAGDLFSLNFCDSPEAIQYLKNAAEMEKSHLDKTSKIWRPKNIRQWLFHLIYRPYRLFFQMLLERSCR